MAVKQYIGARYVPKIEGDYNENRAYEPLSIVTYENSSYTSKKAVPQGVYPTNTEYWVLTGNYNGQVEQYREEVDSYREEVAEIQKEVDSLKNRKFLIVTDSFGEVPTNETFVDYLVTYMGWTADDYILSAEGGSGFCSPGNTTHMTFSQRVNSLAGSMTEHDRSLITDILIVGGTNDCKTEYSGVIGAAARDFATMAHNFFGNAKIRYIFAASLFKPSTSELMASRKMKSVVRSAYYTAGSEKAYTVAYPLADITIAWTALYADGVHPSAIGANVLARTISNYLKGVNENGSFNTVDYLNTGLIFTGLGTPTVTIECQSLVLPNKTYAPKTEVVIMNPGVLPYWPSKNVNIPLPVVGYAGSSGLAWTNDFELRIKTDGSVALFNGSASSVTTTNFAFGGTNATHINVITD